MPEKTDHDLLVDLHEAWIRFEAHYTGHCESDKEVREAVFGKNGTPGLKQDVTVMKTKMGFAQWLGATAGAAGISALVTAIWVAIKGK